MPILSYVYKDILVVLDYLPVCLSGGCLACAVYCGVRKFILHRKTSAQHGIAFFFLSVFSAYILQLTILSRNPGSRATSNLLAIFDWGTSTGMHAFVVENILLFLPLGVFLPLAYQRQRKIRWFLLTVFVFSFAIEIAQLLTGCGYFQLDDLLTNCTGGLLGWTVYKIASLAFRSWHSGILKGNRKH